MHPEILSKNQAELLPFLKGFSRSFYLVGGTAIALHLGHRRSIDFDLFTFSRVNKVRVKGKLKTIPFQQKMIFEDYDQLHLFIHDVRTTFFHYPYSIDHPIKLDKYITLPSLLILAAMKAFALGRRAKWKDYVDLYFILRDHFSIDEISAQADFIYESQFNEKLFREQLAFHKDIDFSEPVEFLIPAVPEDEIKAFLIEKAIDILE